MEEPARIGLTKQANNYLDEMLDSLNSEVDRSEKLIKFDIYRLAVALGIKKGKKPDLLLESSDNTLRINELDPDKALFYAVEASQLNETGESVYRTIERLAEQGIRSFYELYKSNMGRLPWDKILD